MLLRSSMGHACDLCGSRQIETLVHLDSGRALRSDRVVVASRLHKLRCAACGLVQDAGRDASFREDGYYRCEYEAGGAFQEHVFYTPQGPVARSQLLAEWLGSAAAGEPWRSARRALEVGAGAGHLLERLAALHAQVHFEGLEPGAQAAALARARGLAVRRGTPADDAAEPVDLVYGVAVLEHVPSPTAFLRDLRARLRPGGWLLLCQPTQDVPSYDVLFVDHLHHFGSAHLAAYARKTGFRELDAAVGHPWMPNFSLHAWRAEDVEGACAAWQGPPAETTCARTVAGVMADMAALDATLRRLAAARRRVAAFGLHEVYALTRAYSGLGDFPLVCGFDDDPARLAHAGLAFPVVPPQQGLRFGVQDAVLSMNRVYYEQAQKRLAALGIAAHPVLSS
jgi:2-polyprenyl-3-methyl-5-hydroxy-6-metoxy-1,4-benzoquinol methylase